MKATPCLEPHILAGLLEEETTKQDADLAAHLETCTSCRQTLADLAADSDMRDEIACQLARAASHLRAGGGSAACPHELERVIAHLKKEPRTLQSGAALAWDEDDEGLAFLRAPNRQGLIGHFGAYDVMEVIGRGGMGVVLKAFEPALGRVVAIKVLAPRLATGVRARRRFLREGRAAAAVCHDNIVTIHGVDEEDGLPFLVMQHVEGGSLQDRLDRLGPLQIPEIVTIGLQIAAALTAAHAQGLIHRDIKPANILLQMKDPQSQIEGADSQAGISNRQPALVKITDFGLARMSDDAQLTQNGVIAGTPAYMAPEQAKGESVDHRADLFSLGSVLYAMCTATAPFPGSSALAVLRQVIDEAPKPVRSLNPAVPPWLEALIHKLMAKDPAQRFQSAAEFAALLEDGGRQAIPEVRRLKRVFILGLATCLLGCFVLAGFVLLAQHDGGPIKEPTSTEVYYDFKGQPLPATLQLIGNPQWIHAEPEGLRITLPKDRKDSEALIIASTSDVFSSVGDFEVTATLEILDAEAPPPSYGVGLCLLVKKTSPSKGSAALCRLVRAKGRQLVLWDQALDVAEPGVKLKLESGEIPCADKVVRFRLRRSGTTMHYLWAAGSKGDTFQEAHRCEFGGDAMGRVLISGVTGRKPCALDARILDLRIRATQSPELVRAIIPSGGWSIWLALVLASVLLGAAGLALYRQQRLGKRSTIGANQKPAPSAGASPQVSTVCADCGKKLRAPGGLAGKRVKCPHCGKTTRIPAGGADEPSISS